MYGNEPSITARVIRPKLGLELSKLGIRELVRRNLVRTHNLAQHADLAQTDLTDHVNEFTEFDLTIAARVDFLDELGHLLGRQILIEMLERSGDLGGINAVKTRATNTVV